MPDWDVEGNEVFLGLVLVGSGGASGWEWEVRAGDRAV